MEVTADAAFIRRMVTSPRVWRWVQDGCDEAAYQPVLGDGVIYLRDGDAGLFAFKQVNAIAWECHSFMADSTRADAAGKESIRWMFENTSAEKLFCLIPSGTRHAVAFARRVGFEIEGRLKNAALRNGRRQDLIVLGVSKWAEQ
ncbi:hypothetical protein [Achromobacter marplatensis]|uniref:GNAT family N-acetyltransferase n=1 Tax=Achromobacter marplatensis TaxID=470868 RepID=UPI0028E95C57|nr:hypothetical protein [Achromobacter marplatensis]